MYLCIKDGTTNIALTVVANWSPILDISAIVTAANTATTNANTATILLKLERSINRSIGLKAERIVALTVNPAGRRR